MRAVTVRFPGMRATVLRVAATTGLTEQQLWDARERAAEERLATAEEYLAAIRASGLVAGLPERSAS